MSSKEQKSGPVKGYFKRKYAGTMKEFLRDWKWIFSFSKRYKWIVALYTLLGFFSSTLAFAASYVSRLLINIIAGRETGRLVFLIVAMVCSTLFSLLFSCLMSRINAKISAYVNNDIQGEIFDSILDARWEEVGKYRNGDILDRFNDDVSTISTNSIEWIPKVILSFYSFLLTLVVLLIMDPIMALIALGSAPFLILVSRIIMHKNKEYRQKVLEMNSQLVSLETDTIYNYDYIKSFGAAPIFSKELRSRQDKWKDRTLDYNKFQIKAKISITLLSTSVTLLTFGYCLYRLWTGQILFGDMTFFIQQRSSLTKNFSELFSALPGMLNSAVSSHRVRELISLEKEAHSPAGSETADSLLNKKLTVKLNDATFAYTEGENVYDKAAFVAGPNEIVAVLGESGRGKTTLFRLLLGLVDPTEGSVNILDEDGNSYDMNADLRPLVSYVPQGNSIVLGTIADNLRIVKEDATDEEITEALKIAHAWEFVEPIGIDAPLGDRGKGISEGQAQRIAIARAMLRNAPILMLDEATSALDEETERLVLEDIAKHCPDKTVIISSHRPSVLSKCSRVYRISDGRINESK